MIRAMRQALCPLPGLIETISAISGRGHTLSDKHRKRTPQIEGLTVLLAAWILG